MTNSEIQIMWLVAGLGSVAGRTTLTIADAVGFEDLMQAADENDDSDCLKSSEDREFLFVENHALLIEYAEEQAHAHRTTRLKWLAAIKYDGIPEELILGEVQAGLIDNKPTPYHTELINGFIGHLITQVIDSITTA